MNRLERVLVIIKPDAVNRGLIGQIINRFELKGLKIVALKMKILEEHVLRDHYSHLADKPFFRKLVDFMRESPSVLMVVEGVDAVRVVRGIVGPTNSREAPAGTIRGDFGMSIQKNIVHASDSVESAEKEIKRFFREDEIIEYHKLDYYWLYTDEEVDPSLLKK